MSSTSPPRAVWTGALTVGLIVIPVRLYSATEEHAVRLREIHKGDAGRIRHRRVCDLDGQEVDYRDVGRGYELPDGRMVPLTDADLDRLPLPTRHTAQLLGFVPIADVDPISYSGKTYYVGPAGEAAERAYTLLTTALARVGAVAICKVAIRSRERLGVIRPRHGLLVMHSLLWPEEVRDPGGLAPATPVTEREVELAERLMSELTGVETHELRDEYREALEKVVDAKVTGGQIEPLPVPEPAGDLLALLEESVRSAHDSQ
ncbi:hypothetical protein Srufu_080020 (plasmid) [Streptomyces libani subsp. rufus]|nr:hypothetical protein Srufu_080020 [Streptomyces libani subsp. rufus]